MDNIAPSAPAAQPTSAQSPQIPPQPDNSAPGPSRPSKAALLKRHWRWLVPVLLVLAIGGTAAAFMPRPHIDSNVAAKTAPKATATPAPSPVVKLSALTGLPVSPELAARPISGVMVENLYPDARPQSGLQSAGVVYEALAEGGITRFLALFGDGQPGSIGPVRSLRPYYIDWAMEFGASISHAGGSADAIYAVDALHAKNLDALKIGSPTYYRANDRFAPHNLYTNSALLDAINAQKGFAQAPTFTPTPRKADTPDPAAPHPTINIAFSTPAYAVQYRYNATNDDYGRYLYGTPHIDRNTGQIIGVKNIVIEYMPVTFTPAPHDSQYINMPTVGSGKAVVLRDGDAIPATWSKAAHDARTQLTDASGKAIPLNAGNTWYEIVPNGNTVTF